MQAFVALLQPRTEVLMHADEELVRAEAAAWNTGDPDAVVAFVFTAMILMHFGL